MRTALGAWRATYTHGRWVVLSGPTAMIIMQPAPPAATNLVNSIWDKLIGAASIGEISSELTRFWLDSMPNLAAFFWDDEQLYCLLRGSVRVLDADSGEQLASGQGARTWYETTLNTDVRSLLQVKVREVDEADDIFGRLMGDLVEPRRDFIQENALQASVDA